MTARTVRWFDAPDRGEQTILLPCVFRDAADHDDLHGSIQTLHNGTRVVTAPPEAPPATLTPDGGDTVVLRVGAIPWGVWREQMRWADLWRGLPNLVTTDVLTGIEWTIWQTSNAPAEFRALPPERWEVVMPLPDEPFEEVAPYIYQRYPQTRPLAYRVLREPDLLPTRSDL